MVPKCWKKKARKKFTKKITSKRKPVSLFITGQKQSLRVKIATYFIMTNFNIAGRCHCN